MHMVPSSFLIITSLYSRTLCSKKFSSCTSIHKINVLKTDEQMENMYRRMDILAMDKQTEEQTERTQNRPLDIVQDKLPVRQLYRLPRRLEATWVLHALGLAHNN